MKKVFCAAFARFKAGKGHIWFAVLLAVAVAVTATVAAVSYASESKEAPPAASFEDVRESIEYELAQTYDALLDYDGDADGLLSLKRQKAYLEFYLSTETLPADYYSDLPTDGYGGAYMLRFFALGGMFACAIAGVICSRAFFAGRGERSRTALLCGMSREDVYDGENAAGLTVCAAAWAAFTLCMLICALCSPTAKYLVMNDITGGVTAVSVFVVFAARSFCMLAITAAVTAATNLVAVFTCKTDVPAVAVTAALVVLFAVTVLLGYGLNSILFEMISQFIPVVGLTGNITSYTPFMLIAAGLHVVFAVAAYAAGRVAFGRREL